MNWQNGQAEILEGEREIVRVRFSKRNEEKREGEKERER